MAFSSDQESNKDMDFYIYRDAEQLGPYSAEDINGHLANGSFSPMDLAWHEGATEWVPLSSFFLFATQAAKCQPPGAPVRQRQFPNSDSPSIPSSSLGSYVVSTLQPDERLSS